MPRLDCDAASLAEEARRGAEPRPAQGFEDGGIVRGACGVGRPAKEHVAAFAGDLEDNVLGGTRGQAEGLDVADDRATKARQRGESFSVKQHGRRVSYAGQSRWKSASGGGACIPLG